MVNPNEAPEGYIAILEKGWLSCKDCAFEIPDNKECLCKSPCASSARKDKEDVIFIKIETKEK